MTLHKNVDSVTISGPLHVLPISTLGRGGYRPLSEYPPSALQWR